MLVTIAAFSFAILAAFVVAFQVALVFGAPWGHLTLGGRYPGALPKKIRLTPAFSAVLILGFAVVVLKRAQVAFLHLNGISDLLIWVVVTYCFVGILMNAITPSQSERRLWLPVVALMFASSLLVAILQS